MYYTDDSDQLPELPDPGPRDGRHGVDNDEDYDPYPHERMGAGTGLGVLTVPLEDAKRHLSLLIARVEAGEDVIVTRRGHPVARIVSHTAMRSDNPTIPELASLIATEVERKLRRRAETIAVVYPDYADVLPELPDPGPRDGRHGVDADRNHPFGR